MESTRMPVRTGDSIRVWLDRDETIRLPLGKHGLVAHVESGTLMVTQAGDAEDHILEAGDEVQHASHGLAVAWALAPTVVVLTGAGRTAGVEVHSAAA